MGAALAHGLPIQVAKARPAAQPIEGVVVVFDGRVVGDNEGYPVENIFLPGDEIERSGRFTVFNRQGNPRGAGGLGRVRQWK